MAAHLAEANALAAWSVVIPTLNEEAALPACLASLASLRKYGAEVLVVDGGSSDETVSIARQFGVPVLASRPGRAAQMNVGAARTAGAKILFLHADSVLGADVAEALAGLDAQAAWGWLDLYFSRTDFHYRVLAWFIRKRSRWTGIATGDQAMFVSRELFQRVNGFPEQPLMEDVALSRTLREHGKPRCVAARLETSPRRWEQRGFVRTILLMHSLRLRYYLGGDPELLARRYR